MVAVIGDIHGCFYTLKQLVEKIRNKYSDIKIFCVGDLVDRGNYSYEVIEFVLSEQISFTPGNHDLMFYYFFNDPDSQMGKTWSFNGSESTIKSYENRMDKLDAHLNAIFSAPIFILNNDCFISHAGISRTFKNKINSAVITDEMKLKKILSEDLFGQNSVVWCRGRLMNIGKLQVVGHTHRKEVSFDKESNAVYIDTTAFGMNKLTSVIVENNKVIEIIDQKTLKGDSNSRWNYYL